MTRGLAQRRVEPESRQFVTQPLGGKAAIGGMDGIGRDRRDREQRAQPFQRGGQVAVQSGQDIIKLCIHCSFLIRTELVEIARRGCGEIALSFPWIDPYQ